MIFGASVSSVSMRSGAPTFGTPESGRLLLGAGWLEGGLCSSSKKFAMDCDQLGMMAVHGNGIDEALDEALNEFIDAKKAAVPDST